MIICRFKHSSLDFLAPLLQLPTRKHPVLIWRKNFRCQLPRNKRPTKRVPLLKARWVSNTKCRCELNAHLWFLINDHEKCDNEFWRNIFCFSNIFICSRGTKKVVQCFRTIFNSEHNWLYTFFVFSFQFYEIKSIILKI